MATEIESRYAVPDEMLFDKFSKLDSLGEYRLRPQGTLKITDYYLDTKGRALLHQGWACRLRAQDDSWILTLKGPKQVNGAIMSRNEMEIHLARPTEDAKRWPKGEIRDRVQDLTGGMPLRRLVKIKQRRSVQRVVQGLREVADLSLDTVLTTAQNLHHRGYMLECELLPEGNVADLEHLDRILVNEYYLVPECRSKLQQAMQFMDASSAPEDQEPQRQPLTTEALCRLYGVNLKRARYVAQVADALFESLRDVHGLSESRRPLLHAAAMLHDIGRSLDKANRHLLGRDIVLQQPVEGLSEDERQIIAAAIYLHRKKITPQRLANVFSEPFPQEDRQHTLALAAILRMASALKARQARPDIWVERIEGHWLVTLGGPKANLEARRAAARADLWNETFEAMVEWRAAEELEAGKEAQDVMPPFKGGVGLSPQDTVWIAAGRILAFHKQRMLQHEAGTRQGQDPEELHDMRVAIRRMRSVLRLLSPYLHQARVTEVNDALREMARRLGGVRDMDVAIEQARAWRAEQPKAERLDLDPLIALWQGRREMARAALLAYLDSPAYLTGVETLRLLIEELEFVPGSHIERVTIAELAPRLVYISWQVVQAYDAVLDHATTGLLHALRIDGKRLRYALEFFGEVLPREVTALIPDVVALQDHLGELHDAAISVEMLDDLLARHEGDAQMAGARAYREAQVARLEDLEAGFPAVWERLRRPTVSKAFAEMLDNLK